MKIEMKLGEGERAVILDGHDISHACLEAEVIVKPQASYVTLTLVPTRLVIEGDTEVVAILRQLGNVVDA